MDQATGNDSTGMVDYTEFCEIMQVRGASTLEMIRLWLLVGWRVDELYAFRSHLYFRASPSFAGFAGCVPPSTLGQCDISDR